MLIQTINIKLQLIKIILNKMSINYKNYKIINLI